jgi:hypothetical protein
MAKAGAVPIIAEEKSTIIPYKMDLVVDVKENGEGTIKINKLVYTTKGDEGTPFASSKDYGQGEGESKIGEAAEGIKNNVMKELFPNDGNNAEEVPAAPEVQEEKVAQEPELPAGQNGQILPPPPPPSVIEAAAAAAPELPVGQDGQPLPPPPSVSEAASTSVLPPKPPAPELSAQVTSLNDKNAKFRQLQAAYQSALDKAKNAGTKNAPALRTAAGEASKAIDAFKKANPGIKGGGTRRKRRVKQTKKHYKRASTRTRRNKPFYFFN